MEHPDWYPNWRHDAFHELQAKNRCLNEQFEIDRWPRWKYDINTGTLIFSDSEVAQVIAEIQVVGTTSLAAGNFLWAWGNDHWPDDRVAHSLQVRSFGEEHGICELTHDCLEPDEDLNSLGWELTAVCARINGSPGAYRPPRDEGGGLYFTYVSIGWAS